MLVSNSVPVQGMPLISVFVFGWHILVRSPVVFSLKPVKKPDKSQEAHDLQIFFPRHSLKNSALTLFANQVWRHRTWHPVGRISNGLVLLLHHIHIDLLTWKLFFKNDLQSLLPSIVGSLAQGSLLGMA